MVEWFGNPIGNKFVPFGINHLYVIGIYLLGLFFLFLFRQKIKTNTYIYHSIRWILFTVLILSELAYQAWTWKNGIWSKSEHIPLHLCGIASIIAAIALATQHKKLIQLSYFIGFIPAFLAVITPELIYDYPHFRFWIFFIHHVAISWASIYLIITNMARISFKSTLEAYGYLLGYAAIIGFLVNPAIDANYLFLAAATSAHTPLNMLGGGIWYYINLCLFAFIVFLTLFGLHKYFRKEV